jgi:hypothetical protein
MEMFLQGYVTKMARIRICGISRKFDVYQQSEYPGMEIKQKSITGCCDSNDSC